VTENQRPPGGPHRSSGASYPHHDRPGGKPNGAAGRVRGQLWLPPTPGRFRAAGFCVARPCGRTQINQVFAK